MWEIIHNLRSLVEFSWLEFRDFNEILQWYEKSGGHDWLESQISAFRSMLNDSSMGDLGYSRHPFTWCNKREGQHIIVERLDRFLANP